METDTLLRQHLLYLLRGGGAHIDFEEVMGNFPVHLIDQKVEGVPYTMWQVLEHMRITQWDILEFSRNPEHASPPWPDGYWPSDEESPDEEAWNQSIEAFRSDLASMQAFVEDASTDLFAPIEHGDGQTVLREALLAADHNAYHLGVASTLKRILLSK
jgi:hypothetical protein